MYFKNSQRYTACEVSKYGVFSSLYCPVLGTFQAVLIYGYLIIQSLQFVYS